MTHDSVTERSYAPLTDEQLARLYDVATADHEFFTRPDGRSEFADRRVAVTLAQGAARHYLDGRTGVKDLDVWSFYAALPGTPPGVFGSRRSVHRDFGPSEHGRQRYDLAAAPDARTRKVWAQWAREHTGRRVDLYVRPLDMAADADLTQVVAGLRRWLTAGSRERGAKRSSAWHLSRKAVILLDPERRGFQVWPEPD